eukprot:TRINITY_DN8917_c0_g1_i1.p1 TRINITY_DN8917_c0_g1~~TRINITY_DN8917_c0_g1_i1.p1  ORF type:complete len:313 (+),score=51.59 TRINITY_DN8917_c0_g1_i1:271-1209(+)
MKKIFLSTSIKEVPVLLADGLKQRGLLDRVEMTQDISQAEVVVGDPGLLIDLLDKMENTKWVQSTWAGVNKLYSNGTCLLTNVLITRAEGLFGENMAEYVMGQILWKERRFEDAKGFQSRSEWKETNYFRECRRLKDLTLGILGYGNIGKKVAEAAGVFGMRVIGLTRASSPDPPHNVKVTHSVQDVLENSDYVLNLLPETTATVGLLTKEVLSRTVRSPVFINCGRGSVLTEAELLSSLEAGFLSAAVLDVFSAEPLPRDSPLWTHPRVSITPHISALTLPPDIVGLFLDNLERYLHGGSLMAQVNLDAGY